jgi:hypothetical protein
MEKYRQTFWDGSMILTTMGLTTVLLNALLRAEKNMALVDALFVWTCGSGRHLMNTSHVLHQVVQPRCFVTIMFLGGYTAATYKLLRVRVVFPLVSL